MSRVYSASDNIIEEYAEEKRVFVPYEAIPENLINALKDLKFTNKPSLAA